MPGGGGQSQVGVRLSRLPPDKFCRSCGRRITWRKKWERDWDEVRYCSDGCRRRGLTDADRDLEGALLDAVGRRARALPLADFATAQQADAEAVRRAARRLVATGQLDFLQGAQVIDASTARGPVSVRPARRSPAGEGR